MASFTSSDVVLGPNPSTARGASSNLGANKAGTKLVYTVGSAVVVRDVANPGLCEVYSEHKAPTKVARFSPSGNRLLTTCNDNTLSVFDGANDAKWSLRSSAKHNNNTGRFITSFQAEWVRGSDEGYICGSLEHPRGVDVFRVDGGEQPRMDEEENVTAVVSLFAQHPTRNVLVASNASGKCLVWR